MLKSPRIGAKLITELQRMSEQSRIGSEKVRETLQLVK
jgi:hypothetical protein